MNQSDIRGLVRHRWTSANIDILRREILPSTFASSAEPWETQVTARSCLSASRKSAWVNAMLGDEQKCREAGCDNYLAKPIDRSTFLPLISRYAQKRAKKTVAEAHSK